jgi:uncharacterized membrane protein YfcA
MDATSWLLAVGLALLVGGSLGLFGGGGAILTLPILVYALHVEERAAIASSLVVVGCTSAVAAIGPARRGLVVWRVALAFAAAAMTGAFVGGRLAHLFAVQTLLVLFAAVMLAASAMMWRGRSPATTSTSSASTSASPEASTPAAGRVTTVLLLGAGVGVVSGLVGAGGGFLIVPALTLVAGLPLARAIGTSLVVIALQSLAGFAGQAAHVHIDMLLVSVVIVAAVVGSWLGAALGRRVPHERLRRAFAVFVAAMAVFVLWRQ